MDDNYDDKHSDVEEPDSEEGLTEIDQDIDPYGNFDDIEDVDAEHGLDGDFGVDPNALGVDEE